MDAQETKFPVSLKTNTKNKRIEKKSSKNSVCNKKKKIITLWCNKHLSQRLKLAHRKLCIFLRYNNRNELIVIQIMVKVWQMTLFNTKTDSFLFGSGTFVMPLHWDCY